MSYSMPQVILSADVWGSCNRGSKVDSANRIAQLNCKRAGNCQESQEKVFVFICFVSPETNKWTSEIVILDSCREREKKKYEHFPPSPHSFSLLHPPPSSAIVCPSGESRKKKALRQQYALPPAPRQGRQKPRNQRRAHVKSHCEAPSGSLPALAGFPRWSHSDPPAPTSTY